MNKKRENDKVQIGDDDLLYRRFHRKDLRRDGGITYALYMQRKPTTMPDPEISVDLGSLTTPEKTLAADPRPIFGLGVLRVGDVRRLGFTVRYNPNPKNNAHCIIEGVITEADCDRLAEITHVHTLPPKLGA